MSFIVAIDGTAGTGKGTVTKLIAQDLGLLNVDTGALYRCVTLEALNRNLTLENQQQIIDLIDEITIEIKNDKGDQTVFLNQEDVSEKIRTKAVSNMVSQVSSIVGVRLKVTELERAFGRKQNIVMEGRDIGTYVFPNADIKIYLDATPEERARRRVNQNKEQGIDIPYEEVLANINMRDENDKAKEIGALKVAKDAIVIDTTQMTVEEMRVTIEEIIKAKYNPKEKEERKVEIIEQEENKKKQAKFEKRKKYTYEQTKWKLFQRKIVKGFLHFLCLVVYRVKKVGEENVPKEGAYIICANHVNFLDPLVLVITAKRHMNMIGKIELLNNIFLYWLGYLFDVITVKRNSQDIDSIKRSLKLLKEGHLLAIYPEGTRNGLQKNNGKVKNGAAFMAAITGVSVIPVGIQGSFKPFSKVIVNYGKPMDFSQYHSKKPEKEVLEKISDELMDEIIRLTNEKI